MAELLKRASRRARSARACFGCVKQNAITPSRSSQILIEEQAGCHSKRLPKLIKFDRKLTQQWRLSTRNAATFLARK
jgi:hypothetical protein